MISTPHTVVLFLVGTVLQLATAASAQDWPQFRGPNRDGKATGFTVPATWPKTLTQKWKVPVGEGVATPALVGDKVFVFSREDGNEVTRCLDAASGKEIWNDKYPALGASGPAASFSGPRASPAVADGKVVTLGIHNVLSCFDAATGKKLWRKNDVQGEPRFSAASSPMLANGLCIAQLGGPGNGGITAFDLTTGAEKWKWTGDGPGYASPALMTVGDATLVVAETDRKIVAINAADGKSVWETPFAVQGMGYNAVTPAVDGQTIIFSGGGRGTHAVKLEKTSDGFTGKEIWSNPDQSVQFSSPTVKAGSVYGVSISNQLFCLDEATGKTEWSAPLGGASPGMGGGRGPGGGPGAGAGGGRPGGRMGRGGGMGGGGYGSVVDAGSVLVALTPKSELVVFQPDNKAYAETAKIKVADKGTYAYPVLSGNRIFIKDQDSVALLTVE